MGKKKGYNVAEMDLKPEEKKKETKESFTVQDYDSKVTKIICNLILWISGVGLQ